MRERKRVKLSRGRPWKKEHGNVVAANHRKRDRSGGAGCGRDGGRTRNWASNRAGAGGGGSARGGGVAFAGGGGENRGVDPRSGRGGGGVCRGCDGRDGRARSADESGVVAGGSGAAGQQRSAGWADRAVRRDGCGRVVADDGGESA